MPILPPQAPPITIGTAATLACIWEATAPKPGNVYRGADFEDLSYVDFLTSAALIGPIVEQAPAQGVGATVLRAVSATREATGTNTNLGLLLLVVPLAACGKQVTQQRVADLLASLTSDDTRDVYEAIRTAKPGGLGHVDEADVHADAPPEMTLVEAMRLAAERDLVARQYTNNFAQVFDIASWLGFELARGVAVSDAVVGAFLRQLSDHPDSLIARKCGHHLAADVSRRAAAALATADRPAFDSAVAHLDFYLRADGHRRNPGTTADLVAAALFLALLDAEVPWPARFYPPADAG
jgi:triphosphoribosyl-dephospho-CoA synthase